MERLALRYVEKFATTRAKLVDYLRRKLRERGWDDDGAPDPDALVGRLAELGYINDEAFGAARAGSLTRRGYGPRRVAVALRQAGIEEEDQQPARIIAEEGAWGAALAFARKRRIGPFAVSEPDRPAREKAFAALLRAGHSVDFARKIVKAPPGVVPEEDE